MKWSHLLRSLGVGAVLVVMAVGPFLRGLFFWTELLGAISLLSLGFDLWLIGRRLVGEPVSLTGGAPGLALLALLACYLIQFAWAVYPRGNLDWVLRVAAGFMVYVMMRAEAGPALRRWLGWVLVLSAAGVAVVGFLEFTGYFANNPELMKSLSLVNLGDRMATPLQYPNTAAVYLLAALFVAIGLAVEDLKGWKLIVLTSLVTLLALAFFFTVSRGAVVVLPFGLALLFLGLDREKRWPALLVLLAGLAPMAVALKGVGANAAIHNWVSAFRWITAATVGGLVTGAALMFFLRLVPAKVQLAVVGGVLVLGLVGLVAVRPGGTLLPKQASRLFDINLRTANVVYRLTLYQDALKMIADRPLGRGGWGWERSYRQYQTTYYVGQETHSHYMETAVEAGVPGLLALLIGVGGAFLVAWPARSGNPLGWTLAAGAALIAGHSVIDFDLSYGVAWVGMWAMFGAGGVASSAASQRRPMLWGGVVTATVVALLAFDLFNGSRLTDRASELAQQGQADAAKAAARSAIRFDPWNSAPFLTVGDVPSLTRATRLDPEQSLPHFQLAIQLENNKDLEGALREARLALQTAPLVSDRYTKLASLEGTLMVDALGKGDLEQTREFAGDLVTTGTDLQRRSAARQGKGTPWMGQALVMEPVFKLRYGQALYLKGDTKGAGPYLTEASKVGLLGSEADVWLYAIAEQQGDTKTTAQLADKPWVRFRNANPVYKALHTWKP